MVSISWLISRMCMPDLNDTETIMAKCTYIRTRCFADVAEFVNKVVSIAGDEIALWQDKLKGASVTDPEIYK